MKPIIDHALMLQLMPTIREHYRRLKTITRHIGFDIDSLLRPLEHDFPLQASMVAGISLEHLLQDLWRHLLPKEEPVSNQLCTYIQRLKRNIDRPRIVEYMHAIRLTRNRASHIGENVTLDDALDSVMKLYVILQWYGENYLSVLEPEEVSSLRRDIHSGPDLMELENAESAYMEKSFHISAEDRFVDESGSAFVIQIISMLDSHDEATLRQVIHKLNSLQSEIRFKPLETGALADDIRRETRDGDIQISSYLDMLETCRAEHGRQRDRILVFVDHYLIGTVFENLFAGRRPENCVGIVTTNQVENVVIPGGRMGAYFAYMLAKDAIDCMNPEHEHHTDRERSFCVYDYKVNKADIIASMRADALCDDCRRRIFEGGNEITPERYHALNRMFACSGELLAGN